MATNPFTLTVYDKALNRAGFVASPVACTVTPRHNAIGTLELTLSLADDIVPYVTARGARMTCGYRGEQIFSGPRRALAGEGPSKSGTITVTFEDDIRLLWRLLGYPDPSSTTVDSGGGLTQSQKEDHRTGPAETVLKGFVSANKGRDPRPITVAATHGYGSSIDVAIRMLPLADKLMDVVDAAGIGVSVRQTATGLLVDCYQPSSYGRALAEPGGAVLGWSWSEAAPTATAMLIGGPDTGTSREFKRVENTGRRDQWGDYIEAFTDASSETIAADIIAAGTKALTAAGPTAGFKVQLGETQTFHYGGTDGVHVGDLVTAEIAGQQQTDVLREASLSWTRDAGFTVTPTVGEHTDDPNRRVLKLVGNLARGIRALTTR